MNEKKFLGFTFWREGYTIDSRLFLLDMNKILSDRKGGFRIYHAYTDKTFYYYEGLVFINTDIDAIIATDEEAQKYFEDQLIERDKELGCPQ